MGCINISIIILDESLISKIAAGEVIERPASIVKELIENSIDAGSTKIKIIAKEGGKSFLKIADNGSGMSKEDTLICWKRHSTSKIKGPDDLFNIRTLGFRGEALASIAAVSELTIISRQKNNLSAQKIIVRGGKEILRQETGSSPGTIVEIRDLFYNTPARKKYLGSIQSELRHITEIVTKYALLYPDIDFELVHNGKMILKFPRTSNELANISYVYGSNAAKNMVSVFFEGNNIKVSGFVSKPYVTRATRSDQSIFVNNRYIKKNKVISDAINNAYKTFVMTNRYPIAIIKISLDVKKTDVNVHPQKLEIRIKDEKSVYDAVFNAIKNSLRNSDLIPETLSASEKPITAFIKKDLEKKAISDYYMNESTQEANDINDGVFAFEKAKNIAFSDAYKGESQQLDSLNKYRTKYQKDNSIQNLLVKESSEVKSGDFEIRVIGIANKTYIIAEIPGSLVLIDQHAAAERILYEKYMADLKNKKVSVQALLSPEIVELRPDLFQAAIEKKSHLKSLGYDIEEFGANTILIRSLPKLFKSLGKEPFIDLLNELANAKYKIDDFLDYETLERIAHSVIARRSCRSAIKAGDTITLPQIKSYVKKIFSQNFPSACPHGRPIVIKWTFYELEKMFKRIV